VIWLLRHLKPDFKTIADFRRGNRNAFRPVFRQFVLLCRQLEPGAFVQKPIQAATASVAPPFSTR
jgi:hypothetical protein